MQDNTNTCMQMAASLNLPPEVVKAIMNIYCHKSLHLMGIPRSLHTESRCWEETEVAEATEGTRSHGANGGNEDFNLLRS